MKKTCTLPPQVTPQVILFRNQANPLKTKDFYHYPSLTTPPHRNFVEVVRYGCGVCCGWGWWCVVCGLVVCVWCGCEEEEEEEEEEVWVRVGA